jgi:acetyl/propionyl-CoA carboxylase alpha subunit
MLRSLDEFVLEGPRQNIAFHRWLLAHPEFAAGNLSTRFLEEHLKPDSLQPSVESGEVALLAAALHAREERMRLTLPADDGAGSSWKRLTRPRGERRRR